MLSAAVSKTRHAYSISTKLRWESRKSSICARTTINIVQEQYLQRQHTQRHHSINHPTASNKAVCNSRRSFQAIATVHTYATAGSFQAMSSTIRHITACASHIYNQRTLSVFPPGLSTVLKIDPPAFHNAFPFINSVIHDLHRDAIKPRC